ncbi:MAG: 2Fe-2S iron-sulfur cluster binding domain-containing protein, partial [Synergistaceae bacterium]|nr:2Fe-2S iron-sulfur cluster binding domain-containing protein [Synergistaceae bacterium]
MYTITVNGKEFTTDEDKKLIRFLRDDLRLTSVKDGCSEGVCGTCTILMGGRAVRACIMTTKQADGKELLTVEGLSEREREAYVYSFGKVGAVQCGFCTPGMVMSAKALLDNNPNPTEPEIKKVIRGNLCRCTGYKKIIDAIRLTAAILRGDEKIDTGLEHSDSFSVGTHTFRNDVRPKVTGTGLYPDDIYLDGMVHASAVRSVWPRARVLKIDASEAERLPGVLAVLRAEDVPVNKVGHI